MKNYTHNPKLFRQLNKPHGFSLLEFLVAGVIGMIVLIAATGIYFTTTRLNKSALAKLSIQQDLRNASNLIARDARQAGSFGCANLSDPNLNVILPDAYTPNLLTYLRKRDDTTPIQLQSSGIRILSANDFVQQARDNANSTDGLGNFQGQGQALIMTYGDGFAPVTNFTVRRDNQQGSGATAADTISIAFGNDPDNALLHTINTPSSRLGNSTRGRSPIVIASCSRVQVLLAGDGGYQVRQRDTTGTNTQSNAYDSTSNPTPDVGTTIQLSVRNAQLNMEQTTPAPNAFVLGQTVATKLNAVAYVVGRFSPDEPYGLYRFNLSASGHWVGPQKLMGDLSEEGMSILLGYINANTCTDANEDNRPEGAPDNVTSEPTFTFYNNLQNVQNNSNPLPSLIQIKLTPDNHNTDVVGTQHPFFIEATVRAGNVCSNRKITLPKEN